MENKSEKDYPKLLEETTKLQKFLCDFLDRRFEYVTDDHFGFMLLCFISKQREHLQSVLQLVNLDLFSDATIIARNMLEGMIIINWVSEKNNQRALQWRKFCVVTDYRLGLKKCAGNIKLINQDILNRVHHEGSEFLCERYKKNKVQIKNLPVDPYKQSWLFDDDGKELKPYDLFKKDNKDVYEIYTEMSEWIHWNIGSIGRRIKRDQGEIVFVKPKLREGCLALSSAFLSTHYLITVINDHFQLQCDQELDQIEQEYKIHFG